MRELENVLWRNGSVLLFKVAMILLHVFWWKCTCDVFGRLSLSRNIYCTCTYVVKNIVKFYEVSSMLIVQTSDFFLIEKKGYVILSSFSIVFFPINYKVDFIYNTSILRAHFPLLRLSFLWSMETALQQQFKELSCSFLFSFFFKWITLA